MYMYVCSMCMCKCIQYVYVCIYAYVYVSPPWGVTPPWVDPLGAMNFIPLAAAAATCVLKSRPGRGTSCTNIHKLENHVEGTDDN